jgi:hypothetical protein
MAGLVPAIHVFDLIKKDVDARAIARLRASSDALCAGMTTQLNLIPH